MTVRFVLMLPVLAAMVQQTPPRDAAPQMVSGTAVVTGTIFIGPAGSDPARKARVMLGSVDGRVPGQTVATDDEGRFEFRNVPAGRYSIEVQKPGYLRASYGAVRPLRAGTPVSVADGSRTDGLTIRLVHGSAITGTVRDARGRPLPAVSVSALRYDYSAFGERRLSSESSATTDDRGEYRLWGLPPGAYVVAATPAAPGSYGFFPSNDFALMTTADVDRALQGVPPQAATPPPPVPTGNYAPVFFPGSADLTLATTLTIAAAEEREGVDLVVSLIRTARIDAAVTMPDGQPAGSARLTLSLAGDAADLLAGSGAWRPRPAMLDKKGHFTLQDVPPGKYKLLAQLTAAPQPSGQATGATLARPAMWAMSEISVNGADINVSLAMQPAMTIRGRVVFDGISAPPDDVSVLNLKLVPPGSGGNIGAGPPGGTVNADRTFAFVDVMPGQYRVVRLMRTQARWNWWPRSAVANGQDALDAQLKIAPGENADIVLTFTDRPTELSGEFQDATGRPATDYFIVMFPADRALWTPGSRRIVSTRPGNDGHYSMRGLPPGDYLLAALTDLDPQDLNAASFFDQLVTLAVKVSLVEGRTTNQDLRIGRTEAGKTVKQ